MLAIIMVMLLQSTVTVTYTKSGDSILATVTDGKVKVWDHYLSDEEKKILASDPSTLDSKIAVMASNNKPTPPPPDPVVPVEVRKADKIDVGTAKTAAESYDAANTKLKDDLTALIKKAEALPISTRIQLLKQMSDTIDGLLNKK